MASERLLLYSGMVGVFLSVVFIHIHTVPTYEIGTVYQFVLYSFSNKHKLTQNYSTMFIAYMVLVIEKFF